MGGLTVITVRVNEGIRVREHRSCVACGSDGALMYTDLRDRLFGAPGVWSFQKCLNRDCALLWLDPMPVEEDIGRAYAHYYTHEDVPGITPTRLRQALRSIKDGYFAQKYGYRSESLGRWKKWLGRLLYLHPSLRADLDFSVMYLRARPKGRLLDVGCGSGELLQGMERLGWDVEGIDVDPLAVENARRKGLRVCLGTLEAQEYPEQHFDAITMSHVIEHVHHPLSLLKECHRLLKAGGSFVSLTPNVRGLGHRMFKKHWRDLDPPRHLYVFTPEALRSLLEKAGFGAPRLFTTFRDAEWSFLASRSIRRTGRYVWAAREPWVYRVWGRGLELGEWAISSIKRDIGEEIGIMAERR